MPLVKQPLDIPLGGGLQTKLHPSLVQPGASLTLENADFTRIGALSKRKGMTALPQAVSSGGIAGSLNGGLSLYRRKDELLLLDLQSLYSYTPAAARWQLMGAVPHLSVKTEAIAGPYDALTTASPDIATAGTVAVVAWYEVEPIAGADRIMAMVYDLVTHAVIQAPFVLTLGGTARCVQVITLGTDIFVVATSNTQVLAWRLPSAAPTAFAAPITLTNDCAILQNFACVQFAAAANNIALVYKSSASGNISGLTFNAGGVVVAATSFGAAMAASSPIGICPDASFLYVCFKNGAGNLVVLARTAALANQFASVIVRAAITFADTPVGFVSGASVVFHWSLTDDKTLRKFAVNNAGALTTADTVILRRAALLGKSFSDVLGVGRVWPVALYNDEDPLAVTHRLGESAALMTENGTLVASFLRNKNIRTDGRASFVVVSGGTLGQVFAGPLVIRTGPSSAVVQLATFDFNHVPVAAKLGVNLYLTGGLLWEYDGVRVVENGFVKRPTVAPTLGVGTMPDGDYFVAAIYRWTDASGQVHESGVSDIKTITLTGGNKAIIATATTLQLTQKGNVEVVFYCSTITDPRLRRYDTQYNDKAADTVTAVTLGVVATITDEEIYTVGGVVENGPPDSLRSIVAKGQRLYGVDVDGNLWFSKAQTPGFGVTFADELFRKKLRDDPQGNVLSIATMDDRLYVFGPSSLQRITGDGPLDNGLNDDLSVPQRLSSPVGVGSRLFWEAIDDGLVFKATSGFALLDRSEQVHPEFGFPVDSMKALKTTSVVVLTDVNQVRFGHSDGPIVCYDYAIKQWTVHTGGVVLDFTSSAVLFGGQYTVTRASVVYQQAFGTFLDPAAATIRLLVETPWLHVGAIQGFQRACAAMLKGTWKSACSINIEVYIDDQTAPLLTKVFDLSAGFVAGQPVDLDARIGKKCRSVKFRVFDSVLAGTAEGIELISMTALLGGKPGLFKIPAAKRA